VLNLDDEETRALAPMRGRRSASTFSFDESRRDFYSPGHRRARRRLAFDVRDRASGEPSWCLCNLWGAHNASQRPRRHRRRLRRRRAARRGRGGARQLQGLRRRFEVVGERNGVTVVDDFAHNPDKIAATLKAARAGLEGRLLLFFQPHGYGPLRLMGGGARRHLCKGHGRGRALVLSDPVYYGGTVDRSVGSGDMVAAILAAGRRPSISPIAPPRPTASWRSPDPATGS
jgi:UDP-N-acetylmuramate--alanine ligase